MIHDVIIVFLGILLGVVFYCKGRLDELDRSIKNGEARLKELNKVLESLKNIAKGAK